MNNTGGGGRHVCTGAVKGAEFGGGYVVTGEEPQPRWPSMRERHTSAVPISVPSFSLDTKVPAQTGYLGMRDVKTNKRVYKLHELVGDGSKFKFNVVEWDGE
jgi:hypothetical protein